MIWCIWLALASAGDRMTEAEVEKLMTEADVNGDGKIDYNGVLL